ncbi:hypothetical protein Btru_026053 [Bulinus truncatus]|nr:hypothetical protein Btru_026053 [Bulinus truncatus]
METLKKETVKNIAYRHRRAVDIYEFISRETQYKKDIFFNFTTVLDRAKELYASDLNMLETKVTQTLADCSNKYIKLCDTIDEILWEQALIIEKEFVEPIRRMDRTTIDRVIEDMDIMVSRVQHLVREHTSSPDNFTRLRYTMLMDDLRIRTELLNSTLRNLNVIKASFSLGVPLSHFSFSKDQEKRMRWSSSRVMPKKLLRKAFSSEYKSSMRSSIENISSSLSRMMEIVEKTFETKDNNIQQLEVSLDQYCSTSTGVLRSVKISTGLQVQGLENRRAFPTGNQSCPATFILKPYWGLFRRRLCESACALASANGHFSKLGKALIDYLAHLNASNFDIAELVLGDKFLSATSNLVSVSHEMRDNINELYGLLNNVVDCLDNNLKRITADEALSDLLEVISASIGVSVANLSRDISVGIYDIQKSFMRREESNEASLRLLELSNTIMAEYRKFTQSTTMDITFYRRNFIYLDIFFGDISYTVMEQQKVYRGYDLFSDIGGSMGLLSLGKFQGPKVPLRSTGVRFPWCHFNDVFLIFFHNLKRSNNNRAAKTNSRPRGSIFPPPAPEASANLNPPLLFITISTHMATKGSFVQVRQTSSAEVTEEGGRGMEGRVRASSDLTITVDFPMAVPHQGELTKSSCIDFDKDMKSFENSKIETPAQQSKVVPIMQKMVEYCNKFSRDTSFHGLNNVCARNVTIFRRLFWILVIITCMIVLGVIVRERIIYFNSNPSTINVVREYDKSILFPAVTICNENQYSISKAFNLQLNQVLMTLLTHDTSREMNEEHANIRMNELNVMLGNDIENMLLSCQWHEGGACGPSNFTEIITDGGLCYTFNGKLNATALDVHNIGSEKGVRFLINTEEYERMPLSSMSSGIRILVHEQGEYPLVRQLGQSVSPGNHAFISLQLNKEIRLGPPYDDCDNGNLRFIPNNYHYTLPACQTECYFAHTLSQCGCSDFFIPANYSACTLSQYVKCLRNVQRQYPIIENIICDCHTPCKSKYIQAGYSYGALSELAIETLKPETIKRIQGRYRKAVDIYQYISRETQYKKRIFLNFTTALDRAKQLYASDLNMLETKVTQTLANCSKKCCKLFENIHAILKEQALIVRKEFFDPVKKMDRTTIDRVIDDMFMITARVQKLVLDHTSRHTSDTRLRYIVLMDDLRSRAKLLDATLRNLNTIKDSFSLGNPMSNYNVSRAQARRIYLNDSMVMPKKLLRKAMANENVSIMRSSIENISSSLSRMMGIVEKTFETKDNNIQQLEEVVREFTDHCNSYVSAKEKFFDETVEWPLRVLEQKGVTYRESKLSRDFHFKAIVRAVQKETVRIGLSLASANGYFSKLGQALGDYMDNFNVSNFEIADMVLGDRFVSAASNLAAVSHEMRDNINDLYGLLNNVIECQDDNLKMVVADEALSDLLEVISSDIGVSVTNLSRDISVGIYDIQKSFMRRQESNEVSLRLLELSNTIRAEYRKFTESTKMDLAFYRRNFLYLDIFFGDISFTMMQQQKVYRGYDLFSDIGGSMGLLMATKSSFVQVRQTSSAQVKEEGGRGIEGRVTASSDLTITVDFPLAMSHPVDFPKSSSADPARSTKSFDNLVTEIPPKQLKLLPAMKKVVESCDKFSQDATFHGMNNVCARNVTIFRKYSGLSCTRAHRPTSIVKPITMNVEREYEKSIPFPAVTICNENQYRLTGSYDAPDHTTHLITRLAGSYDAPDHTTHRIIRRTDHTTHRIIRRTGSYDAPDHTTHRMIRLTGSYDALDHKTYRIIRLTGS